jgi:hypothetical protein
MLAYIEYELGNGATILIEAPEEQVGGIIRASSEGVGEAAKVKRVFQML